MKQFFINFICLSTKLWIFFFLRGPNCILLCSIYVETRVNTQKVICGDDVWTLLIHDIWDNNFYIFINWNIIYMSKLLSQTSILGFKPLLLHVSYFYNLLRYTNNHRYANPQYVQLFFFVYSLKMRITKTPKKKDGENIDHSSCFEYMWFDVILVNWKKCF